MLSVYKMIFYFREYTEKIVTVKIFADYTAKHVTHGPYVFAYTIGDYAVLVVSDVDKTEFFVSPYSVFVGGAYFKANFVESAFSCGIYGCFHELCAPAKTAVIFKNSYAEISNIGRFIRTSDNVAPAYCLVVPC